MESLTHSFKCTHTHMEIHFRVNIHFIILYDPVSIKMHYIGDLLISKEQHKNVCKVKKIVRLKARHKIYFKSIKTV